MSTQATESEYGLSLILHSESNKDIFKYNKPTSFTNIFKKGVKLSEDAEYEIALGNIHIPSHQSVLVKNDYERSQISYNLGMFLYNNSTGKWDLLKNSNKELWRLVPDTDFEGIDARFITSSQKLEYITSIFESLTLGSHSKLNENCLELFLNTISKKSEPFAKRFIEEYKPEEDHTLWFKTFPFSMNQDDKYDFFEKLLRVLSVEPISYIKNVAHSFKPYEKRFVEKIFNKIKTENDESLTKINQVYYSDLYSALWEDKTKKIKDGSDMEKATPIIALYITYGDRMTNFLSVENNSNFIIGYCGFQFTNPFDSNQLPIPKFKRSNLDTLFIYSDLVEHSVRVGSHLTNLLAIVTVNKNKLTNMINPLHISRPLAHKYFQSGSVRITDQMGEDIEFEKNSFSVLELVIKKREKI